MADTRGDVENADICFVGHGVTCLTLAVFWCGFCERSVHRLSAALEKFLASAVLKMTTIWEWLWHGVW
jgi:hypothetical protein